MIPSSSPFSYIEKASKIALLATSHRQVVRYVFDHGNPARRNTPEWKLFQKMALMFLAIENSKDLCRLVRKKREFVEKELLEKNYQTFLIPKKKGGVRVISAPSAELALIQRRLNTYLQYYYIWVIPRYVHGFVGRVPGSNQFRTTRTNAKKHVGQTNVLNIDLKDFFSNISSQRVYEMFKSELFRFNELTAATLTGLLTYDGSLPAGAPTSPVISNFICMHLDAALGNLAEKEGLMYSRYADDITLSWSNDSEYADVLLDALSIIKENGFVVNEKKIRLQRKGTQQLVTGIVVNEKLNPPRKLLKLIRAMLHDWERNGLDVAARRHLKMIERVREKDRLRFMKRLKGWLRYCDYITRFDNATYRKLYFRYHELIKRDGYNARADGYTIF